MELHLKKKIFPNNGILFNGVLRPKLLNIPLNLLQPHIAYFDNIIVLPLLVFGTLGYILSVFFLDF